MKKTSTFLAMLFLTTFCFTAKAQMTTLLAFTGSVSPSYGGTPQGNLYYDGTYLYGLTATGGTKNLGVLFKIKPNGTGYDTLINFRGASNGQAPHGSLISDGTYLYGMTQYGGTGVGAAGDGTVFKIMPNGTGYFKMYDFDGTTNGKAPFSSLYYDGTNMYGMTQAAGTYSLGTIFKIKPSGAYANGYAKLIDFSGATGAAPAGEPEATLISDGTSLYALGYNGGKYNKGAIFKLNPTTLAFDTLMSFNGTNGSYPTNALIYDGTYLYGMTESGGTNGLGTIFKIKPNGSGYDTLMNFRGASNGAVPHGGLYFDGTYLYGAASGGGVNNDGILFKIKRNGTGFTDLYDFDGAAHGKAPRGDLISDGTNLYGMTVNGGTNNLGVVFKFQYCTPPTVIANASATTICATNSVTLTGSGASTYSWTGGINNGVAFTPANTATYTVTGTDTVSGCKNTATKVITVNALPTVTATSNTTSLCSDSSATLSAMGANTYTWSTNQTGVSIVVSPTITTSYSVTGTDVNNCTNTYTLTQVVANCNTTGINSLNQNKNTVIAYPIPVKNNLLIQSEKELGVVTIYNSLGEIIYKEGINSVSHSIDISKQASGIYFLQTGNSFIKVIKE